MDQTLTLRLPPVMPGQVSADSRFDSQFDSRIDSRDGSGANLREHPASRRGRPDTQQAASATDGDPLKALRYAIPMSIGMWAVLIVVLTAVF